MIHRVNRMEIKKPKCLATFMKFFQNLRLFLDQNNLLVKMMPMSYWFVLFSMKIYSFAAMNMV